MAFYKTILAISSDRTQDKKPSFFVVDARVPQPARVKGRVPVTLKNRPLLIYLEAGVSFMQNAA
ncbi:MAG: hypothetical protein JGK38_29385 [Microcoleus sp. PH2017_15_JOR_U_A]|uniref:hypothetical protein n=1 Tax=Microcoleus sp. PH2017_15_JOR_U_A TaxID=2798826 RepID=UPI001DC7A8CB|nr:hypothetical protein [Microcoleus sp. PH2017_15_JOR_U_A]MCC3500642.1 hypothetical protein [Microcoleus sp. PH2017_15_JOR_U_A]